MKEKKIKQLLEKYGFKYPTDKTIIHLVKESFEEGIKEKIEICGVIGCMDWEKLKESMIVGLITCNDEKSLFKLIEALINGIGTPKQLAKKREELGIHHFTENELDTLDKFDKKI